MTERRCEKCGASDADNEVTDPPLPWFGIEIWSWTGADGRWRVRCRKHLPRSRRLGKS